MWHQVAVVVHDILKALCGNNSRRIVDQLYKHAFHFIHILLQIEDEFVQNIPFVGKGGFTHKSASVSWQIAG